MKTTDLISALLDDVAEHGPREVRIALRSGTMPVAEVTNDVAGHVLFLRTQRAEATVHPCGIVGEHRGECCACRTVDVPLGWAHLCRPCWDEETRR